MDAFRRQDGAAAVEFGLLLPLLVMLAFGIIDFSTAYNRSQGMEAGVREAARYAASGDITEDLVEGRLENSLQTNEGGSGFPAAGGTVQDDITVDVEYFADKDAFDADTPSDVPGRCTDAYAVRVTGSIVDDAERRLAYGLSLPLIPGAPFELSHQAQAIFRCLG